MLPALAAQPGRVSTRYELINRVRGYEFDGYERTVDSHIKNLRRKIEPDPTHPTVVQTVTGVGYGWASTVTAERDARRSPLTVRLTVTFVLVAVAAVVALSVLTLWRTKHTVGRLADERQQATAESIAETLALAYRQGGGWQGVDIHPPVMIAVQADAAVAVHNTAGDELDLHNSMADTSKPAGMSDMSKTAGMSGMTEPPGMALSQTDPP